MAVSTTRHALLFSLQGSLSIHLCAIPRALESLHDSTTKWGNDVDRYVRCDVSFNVLGTVLADGLYDVRLRIVFTIKKRGNTLYKSRRRWIDFDYFFFFFFLTKVRIYKFDFANFKFSSNESYRILSSIHAQKVIMIELTQLTKYVIG